MYIKFDKQKMEIEIWCGVLETYKPSKKIKEINTKVNTLKTEMQKFMDEIIEPKIIEINRLVQEENEKHFIKEGDK